MSVTQTLLHVLAVIGLVVAIWLALSPPAYVAKLALAAVGALALPSRVVELTRRYGHVGGRLDQFRARVSGADAALSASDVRVVLDARHKRLGDALKSTEAGVRKTVANVEGLAGGDGPANVLQEIDTLRERTKLVDRIDVELADDIGEQSVRRVRALSTFVVCVVFAVLFVIGNGMLLNLFFRDLITLKLLGVPVSLLLAFIFVLAEMGLGFLLASASAQPGQAPLRWLLIVMISLIAGFEAVVLGLVSNEFELDLALLETYPLLKFWMAPVGFVLTTATSVTGFMAHKSWDELAEYSGAKRLRRDLREVDAFVRDLPRVWERVEQKALRARGAIDAYLTALRGGRGDIGNMVQDLRGEREALSETLLTVRPEAWPSAIDGGEEGRRAARAQNVMIFVVSAVGVIAFAAISSLLLRAAMGASAPDFVAFGAGVSMALGFYTVGWLSLSRLQLLEEGTTRVYPVRAGVLEYVVAGILAISAAVGLIWAGATVLGDFGVAAGIMLFGVGLGGLSFLGHLAERAGRGAMIVGDVGLCFIGLCLGVLSASVVFLLLWVAAIAAWLLWAVLTLLAKPVELLIEAFKRRSQGAVPPAPSTIDATA